MLRLIDEAAAGRDLPAGDQDPRTTTSRIQPFVDLGYRHVALTGMKGYNGVAVLSRLPFESVTRSATGAARSDCRHIA